VRWRLARAINPFFQRSNCGIAAYDRCRAQTTTKGHSVLFFFFSFFFFFFFFFFVFPSKPSGNAADFSFGAHRGADGGPPAGDGPGPDQKASFRLGPNKKSSAGLRPNISLAWDRNRRCRWGARFDKEHYPKGYGPRGI